MHLWYYSALLSPMEVQILIQHNSSHLSNSPSPSAHPPKTPSANPTHPPSAETTPKSPLSQLALSHLIPPSQAENTNNTSSPPSTYPSSSSAPRSCTSDIHTAVSSPTPRTSPSRNSGPTAYRSLRRAILRSWSRARRCRCCGAGSTFRGGELDFETREDRSWLGLGETRKDYVDCQI